MKPMIAILSTGTELTTGRSKDTNGPKIASELVDQGFRIYTIEMLPDDPEILAREITTLIEKEDLSGLIMTGGMGATDDDHTASVLSRVTRRPLVEEQTHYQKLVDRAHALKGRINLEAARKQVRIVEGAIVLPNQSGIAPGMLIEVDRPGRAPFLIAAMSGFPQEMWPIFYDRLLPHLKKRLPGERSTRETFFLYGINESDLQARINEYFENSDQGLRSDLEWGVSAGAGRLKVFIDSPDPASVQRLHSHLQESCSDAYLPATAEEVLHDLAKQHSLSIGFAESCTGGLIGKTITDLPGSSSYFMGSLVTYSNQAKIDLLGVDPETIKAHGAVSEQTAMEMAKGARRVLHSDYAVAVTGIAGPDGGTREKPVGTVFIGISGPGDRISARRIFYPLDRDRIREYTSGLALFYLIRRITEEVG